MNQRARLSSILIICAAVLVLAGDVGAAPKRIVGNFERGFMGDWDENVLDGHTKYEIRKVDGGRKALRAVSDGTGSGLTRSLEIDLKKTGTLKWSWKVDGILKDIDEKTKNMLVEANPRVAPQRGLRGPTMVLPCSPRLYLSTPSNSPSPSTTPTTSTS